jgi:iron-sulfur cluster repair protein YtfE (RIC family)
MTKLIIDSRATVNDLLLRYPATIRVFNAFGVDACCGGAATLAEAAEAEGIELAALLEALTEAAGAEAPITTEIR